MYSEHLQLAEYKVLPDFAIQAVLSQLCPHLMMMMMLFDLPASASEFMTV